MGEPTRKSPYFLTSLPTSLPLYPLPTASESRPLTEASCYGEFITADNLMNANCGDGNAAYVSVTAYDKTYGRTNAGVEICF